MFSVLAASPDGVICNEDGTPLGTLEIKCPYSQRNTSVVDACKNSTFFCQAEESNIRLKTTHNYYYQVQGQMAILNLPWYDFVVAMDPERHPHRENIF